MYIHDDADKGAVLKQTVTAMLEAARHIGRDDCALGPEQIAEIETAIRKLQGVLAAKKG